MAEVHARAGDIWEQVCCHNFGTNGSVAVGRRQTHLIWEKFEIWEDFEFWDPTPPSTKET